jgi:hypothetical protein
MTRIADQRSIVAVDPNSRGLAFVFFEGGQLLDWGTRRRDGEELNLLDELLHRYKADILILEDPDAPRCERRPRKRQLLRILAESGKRKGITVIAVGRYAVRQGWANQGITTKHGVATQLAAMFPEIEPLVPRKRKPYRSEQTRADIFDALSLITHALNDRSDMA